jgi:ribosomal protein L7/L12
MIKILLEGNEAAEYCDQHAELGRVRELNAKLLMDISKAGSAKPTQLSDLTDLMSAISTNSYVAAIKAVRNLTGVGVMDGKKYIESFFSKFETPTKLINDSIEEKPKTKECIHESYYSLESGIYVCNSCKNEFEKLPDSDSIA